MQEDRILYDFLQPAEWDLPGEYQTSSHELSAATGTSLIGHFVAFARGSLSLFLKLLRLPLRRGQDVFQSLVSLLESRIAWQLDLHKDGHHLAILQDSHIEIRSSDTEFARAVKVEIGVDLYPHWRKLAWSPDGDYLVYVSSSGFMNVISATGKLLLSTDATTSGDPKPRKFNKFAAPSTVLCIKCKADIQSLFQVIVVSYGGLLKSYLIKSHSDITLQHTFSFADHLPSVVAAVQFSEKHNLLLVGSCSYENNEDFGVSCSVSSVTSWRQLDGAPFYARALEDSQASTHEMQPGLLKSFKQKFTNPFASHQDLVFELVLSPNGSLLACLDCEGTLTIWKLPSLRQHYKKSFAEQAPDCNDAKATLPETLRGGKGPDYYVNIRWWSDESLILSRISGAVTVVAIGKNLFNLLGSTPEQFEPGCLVTHSTGAGFFILECEGTVKKSRLLSFGDGEGSSEGKGEPVDSMPEEMLVKKVVREALFYVTDSDRFRPRSKSPRVVHRSYRLFFLQSMTPEELFHRKISQEEYGEAVALAQRFDLDADLVYQTQWKACEVSKASIADYLAKISKIDWVLRECLTRVSGDCDAARELFLFGLNITNIWDVMDEDRALVIKPIQSPTKREAACLKAVDVSKFTSHQWFLCQCRKLLFSYLDRLSTYEVILGGPVAAEERFSKEQFQHFRSRDLLEAAVSYAQAEDWRAVQAIFTHHGDAVLPHWLAIISHFPETMPPKEYELLLPEISTDDPNAVMGWEQEWWRTADWVEKEPIRSKLEGDDEFGDQADVVSDMYTFSPHLKEFSGSISVANVCLWYRMRAEEIEKLSGQVDNALQLVKLGLERGATDLDKLANDLTTLQTISYESGSAAYLSLDGLRALPYDKQLMMIMEKSLSKPDVFVTCFQKFAVPFLARVECQQAGTSLSLMKNFLVENSREDLEICLAVCKESKEGGGSLISDKADLMEIALECVYACERSDQLPIADQILECLPSKDRSTNSKRLRQLHADVDTLEDIICGSELLQNHDIQRPIHYLKDIKDNKREAEELMVKVSRAANRKSPPPSEQQWKQVLRDMLSLQKSVFSCLDPLVCYNVFAESLLCCGRMQGIALAGSLLTSSAKERPEISKLVRQEKEKGFAVRLSFEKSVELVLSAAREYFNSATSLKDRDMDLAKSCLGLLEDRPPDVQTELNLISALAILSDFGVKMLPLQVRLAAKKLSIIEEVLRQPAAYKSAAKLEQLGELVGVSSVSEVRVSIAEFAIQNDDYKTAATMCQLLIDKNYSDAWQVCRQLGECNKFDDLDFRKELFAFSLSHCPSNQIEPLLRACGMLEVEAMFIDTAKKQESLSLQTTWSLVGRSADAVHGLVGLGAGAVSGFVSRSAGAVESLVGSRMDTRVTRSASELMNHCLGWMQNTSKLLRRSTSQRAPDGRQEEELHDEDEQDEEEEQLMNCVSQSAHSFYGSLMPSDLAIKHSFDYNMFEEKREDVNHELIVNKNLIRMAKLAEARCHGEESEQTSDALVQLAMHTLCTDLTLALGYLLALPQAEFAEECFQRLLPTQLSLQLAIYYYALHIYVATTAINHLQPQSSQHPYCHSPADLVQHVTGYACQETNKDVAVAQHISQLKLYQEKLIDFGYARKLSQLDRSIDSSLFAQDEEYRQQTVFNLSRTIDEERYSTALAVAKRYNVPLFDVLFCHLKWLLTKSEMNVNALEQRLQTLGIIRLLLEKPTKFADCLHAEIYSELPGSNLNRLLCYYSLLVQCVKLGAEDESPVCIDSHIKLLKKLKQAASGLDYKMLMCGYDVEEVLRPVLTNSNVHVFAKTSNSIPVQGSYLTPSGVFLIYCKKLFWEGDGKESDESKASHWVHRYEICQEFSQRLTAIDFKKLLDDIVCSQQATQLPLITRMDVVRRAIKFSKSQASGKRKITGKDIEDDKGISYQEIADQLTTILTHLQSLEDPLLHHWMTSDKEEFRGYAIQYDLTAADRDRLRLLLESMLCNGESPETIVQLLQLANSVTDHQLTIQSILTSAVSELLQILSLPDYGSEGLDELASVIHTVATHIKSGGEMLSQESLVSLVRPFCANVDLPVEPRTAVLQLLEKNFTLGSKDSSLLLFYRTEAIVSRVWNHTVTLQSVDTLAAQASLFDELLSSSSSLEHFQGLVQLLLVWPTQPQHAASRLLSSTLNCNDEGASHAVVAMRKKLHGVHIKCDRDLYSTLCEKTLNSAICYALVTPHSELHGSGIEILKTQNDIEESDELLELLLIRRQAVSLVSTRYYDAFIKYVLAHQKSPAEGVYLEHLEEAAHVTDKSTNVSSRVSDVVHQLYEAGLWGHAGSLLLASQDIHPLLRTMDSAMHALTSTFGK
ncbi:NBAS subunit of NRZ tethering complex-like isoform X2 [Corticium candelabrum]|uniref:NBAS subunit of NRZ tethering complex-like isoform X2 n=1 Tax=Corticium candelabrum TaxID=121492 RepID=UPI002E255AB0|nr:NBAS subunit of NRZ tethering complex-like isoform X2 [Corticium candelabrum]